MNCCKTCGISIGPSLWGTCGPCMLLSGYRLAIQWKDAKRTNQYRSWEDLRPTRGLISTQHEVALNNNVGMKQAGV